MKKEIKQGLVAASEISKKKQLKIAEFELKEKEQFDFNNKLPLGEIKNYTTGR